VGVFQQFQYGVVKVQEDQAKHARPNHVWDCAWAAADHGYVEGLGAPSGPAGECGVALKVDGEEAGRPIVMEVGERVRESFG